MVRQKNLIRLLLIVLAFSSLLTVVACSPPSKYKPSGEKQKVQLHDVLFECDKAVEVEFLSDYDAVVLTPESLVEMTIVKSNTSEPLSEELARTIFNREVDSIILHFVVVGVNHFEEQNINGHLVYTLSISLHDAAVSDQRSIYLKFSMFSSEGSLYILALHAPNYLKKRYEKMYNEILNSMFLNK